MFFIGERLPYFDNPLSGLFIFRKIVKMSDNTYYSTYIVIKYIFVFKWHWITDSEGYGSDHFEFIHFEEI